MEGVKLEDQKKALLEVFTVFLTYQVGFLFQGWRNPKEHKLYLGMKLEAVHPLDPTSICVASVARVFDAHHFLVKIDDLIATQEEIANCFIAHKGSAGIFEIGFCHKNGLPLQQPRGMFQ